VQRPAEELDVIDREPEDLALPQPAPGGDGRGDPVPRRQRCVHIQHMLGRPGRDLAGDQARSLDRCRSARVLGDPLVVDGC
jgi:hypothetical protein